MRMQYAERKSAWPGVRGRECAIVFSRQRGEIRRRYLQCGSRRTRAFRILAVADGTVLREIAAPDSAGVGLIGAF